MTYNKPLARSRPPLGRPPRLNYGTERPDGQPLVKDFKVDFKGSADLSLGGTSYGAAEAGTANAEIFYKQGVCAALDWNTNVFYFEAFDEPWKPASTGADGQPGNENHWGAYNVDRSPKFSDYSCKYSS